MLNLFLQDAFHPVKPNQKIHIAGMVIGFVLLLLSCKGLLFAMDRAWAFLNFTRISDPAVTSTTNNLVFCTLIAGTSGLLLLALSIVFFIRTAHSRHAMQTPGSNHPGKP
jgi:hypothetical protein